MKEGNPKILPSIPKFGAYENNPNKVVRTQSFDQIKEIYGPNTNPELVVELGKKLFKELGDKYNIPVPVEFNIIKNEKGEHIVHIITDKIEGLSLEEVEPSPETIRSVENLYTTIAKYYLDKSKSKEPHLADINAGSQYVYGKKVGTIESKIYLVDTDLYINKGDVALLHNVKWLVRHMPFKIPEAQEYIEEILNAPLSENLSMKEKITAEKEIKEAQDFLSGSIKERGEVDDVGFIPTPLF